MYKNVFYFLFISKIIFLLLKYHYLTCLFYAVVSADLGGGADDTNCWVPANYRSGGPGPNG